MTLREMNLVDSCGLPRFEERRAKAMIDLIRRERRLPQHPPDDFEDSTGIVIAGGGRYLPHAWVAVKNLRTLGCSLPIQVWYLGPKEMPSWATHLFTQLDAQPIDVYEVMKSHPTRQMSPWISKNFAVRHAPWRKVIFCDADSFASRNPEELLPQIDGTGGLFFSDVANHCKTTWGYVHCSLLPPAPPNMEWEAGQYYVDKHAGWMGLQWTLWLNEHTDVFFKLGHGDKFTLELGFRMSQVPILVSTEAVWSGWGISQRWQGIEWFRHCMGAKRNEVPWPEDIGHLFAEWKANTLGKSS